MTQPSEKSTCPDCGSVGIRRTYELSGGGYLHAWQCGTEEHASGARMRGVSCYETELASLKAQLAEAEKDNSAGRELMRTAWREFNAIRARDGAPAGVSHEYWNQLTEQLRELVGNDDAKPWMTKAASVLVKPWENRNAHLSSEVVDLELKLAAATSRAERAENEAKRLWDGASRLADWYDRIEPPESREKFVKFANALRAQPVEGNDGI